MKWGLHPSRLPGYRELINTSWPANLFVNMGLHLSCHREAFRVQRVEDWAGELFYQDGTAIFAGCAEHWERNHLCKHNDNIVSAHSQKTMGQIPFS